MPATWFAGGIGLIMLASILPVAPELETFIHPWRVETALAVFSLGFALWAIRDPGIRAFISSISFVEIAAVILPVALFAFWGAVSAVWASSRGSVLHHTAVWILYLEVYLLGRSFLLQPSGRRKLFAFSLVLLVLICVSGIVIYYPLAATDPQHNIAGPFARYSEVVVALLPVLVVAAVMLKGRSFAVAAAIAALSGLFIFATSRRAAIALAAFAFIGVGGLLIAFRPYRPFLTRFASIAAIFFAGPVLFNTATHFLTDGSPLAARMNHPFAQTSSDTRQLLNRIAFQMYHERPLTGVGADNFGNSVTEFRKRYSESNPEDPLLAIGEDVLPERAHNEYLQVLSELGLPGFILFIGVLFGPLLIAAVRLFDRTRLPLLSLGALVGIVIFLASSVVSSYSFRLAQNGIVFFLLLALAGRTLFPKAKVSESPFPAADPALVFRSATVVVLCASLSLAAYSIYRVRAVWVSLEVVSANTIAEGEAILARASEMDPSNAVIRANLGNLRLADYRPADAVPELRAAIDLGRSTSMDYSYLATAYILANERPAAAQTLAEACLLYPRSVFVRSRYGVVLAELGRTDEANVQFRIAEQLGREQALTWRMFLESGGKFASERAYLVGSVPIMDLQPKAAIYAVKAERELRFPEERIEIPGMR